MSSPRVFAVLDKSICGHLTKEYTTTGWYLYGMFLQLGSPEPKKRFLIHHHFWGRKGFGRVDEADSISFLEVFSGHLPTLWVVVDIYICIYKYIYAFIEISICIYRCMCIYIYVCIHIYIYIYIVIKTYCGSVGLNSRVVIYRLVVWLLDVFVQSSASHHFWFHGAASRLLSVCLWFWNVLKYPWWKTTTDWFHRAGEHILHDAVVASGLRSRCLDVAWAKILEGPTRAVKWDIMQIGVIICYQWKPVSVNAIGHVYQQTTYFPWCWLARANPVRCNFGTRPCWPRFSIPGSSTSVRPSAF